MKTKISYICDICGCEYGNELDCRMCEKSHQQVVKVEPHYCRCEPYPDSIDVTFPDGRIDKYVRIFPII